MPLFFLDRSIHILPYALTYDQTVMQQINLGTSDASVKIQVWNLKMPIRTCLEECKT
jgi:hypothetical protein